MTEAARLVTAVVTKGVKSATDELKKFGESAGRADDESDKFAKGVAKAGAFALKAGTAIAATGVALAAMAIKASEAEREWQNLATIARQSTEDFKASAFATDQVGVSAEKLSDISKDVNEKLGEFIATGGGGFRDFFEQVAPLIDLTAEELQNLSGPEVLQRVKNAMDEANVSAERQSFYLESIASDATKLIPLLSNHGAEMERLTAKYDALNESLRLSVDESKGLEELSAAFGLLGNTAENAGIKLSGFFSEELSAHAEDWAASISIATNAAIEFFDALRDAENQKLLPNINERINAQITALDNLKKASESAQISPYESQDEFARRIEGYKAEEVAIMAKIEALRKNRDAAMGIGDKRDAASNDPAFGIQAPTFQDRLGSDEFEMREADMAAFFEEELAMREEQDRALELSLEASFEAEAAMGEERLAMQEDLMARSTEIRREWLAQQEQDELDAINARLEWDMFERDQKLSLVEGGLDNVASLMRTKNKELFRIGQVAAIASATISGYQAIANAAAVQPYPVGLALAASEAINVGVRIAAIKSAGNFEHGGIVGGNSFTGDNMQANVNSGEMILNRQQQSNLFKMANGNAGGGGVNIVINNNASGTAATQTTSDNGDIVVTIENVLNQQVLDRNSRFNKNMDSIRGKQRAF